MLAYLRSRRHPSAVARVASGQMSMKQKGQEPQFQGECMDGETTTTSEPRAHRVNGNLIEITSQETTAEQRPSTIVGGACPAPGAKSTSVLSSIFTNNTCPAEMKGFHEAVMVLKT